jgi:hypothetical protein
MEKIRTDPGMDRWFIPAIGPGFALDSMFITFDEVFTIFFMQHWGKGWQNKVQAAEFPGSTKRAAASGAVSGPQGSGWDNAQTVV